MSKMRFSRFSKCLKTTRNSPEQHAELTQKYAAETKTPNIIFIFWSFGHYYGVIIESLESRALVMLVLNLTYHKNKLYETLKYWSRDQLNFNFFTKGSRNSISIAFCAWFFNKKKCFSCYVLVTDQISLPDSLYSLRYCAYV